jgi:hypothetical protein
MIRATLAALAVAAGLSGCDNPDATIPRDGYVSTILPSPAASPETTPGKDEATEWNKRTATALTALQQSTRAIDFAMGNQDFDSAASLCTQIGDAGRSLGGALPSPNDEINSLLTDAVKQIAAGEQICKSYGPDTTDAQTKQFADAINAAEAKLSASMHVW